MERIIENEQEVLKLQGFTDQQAHFLWSLKLLVRDGRLGGSYDAGNPFKRNEDSEFQANLQDPNEIIVD